MRVPITLLALACAMACGDRPPITRERGHVDDETVGLGAPRRTETQAERESSTETPQRTGTQPERETPPETSPNEAEAITPSSVTWRWRANADEHQLFIRRRGEARCDIDGLACEPAGRLREPSALFERLDRLIYAAFAHMLPGALPANTQGDYEGVQVVLANGQSRHAHLSAESPASVRALILQHETLVNDPTSFVPAP